MLLNIRKQSGTNTVEVANLLKERLDELRKHDAEGLPRRSRPRPVGLHRGRRSTRSKEHLIIGGGLAAVVVFFFLANIRATIIAALSIPTSIIAAFAIVKYMGFTLNSLTLLALTLSVGIVIDDAIVVMENIFRYIEEKKYTPYEAAIAATGEIGLAVMAITLSLVAVFLPIAMMEGIVGRFLKSFGITMAATILVSMLVSFTLTPMLAARWFKTPTPAMEDGRRRSTHGARPTGQVASQTDTASSKGQVVLSRHRERLSGGAAVLAAASLAGRAGRDRLHGHAADAVSRCCRRTSFPTTTRRSFN